MDLNRPSIHPRVLVVDDEPLLRIFNVDMLSEAGFEVLEACNASEALSVLETTDGIQVVFTDVEMPGTLDGFALADRIGVRWPKIGVLVTSGRRYPERLIDAPARRFLPKPYAVSHVVELIDAFVARH